MAGQTRLPETGAHGLQPPGRVPMVGFAIRPDRAADVLGSVAPAAYIGVEARDCLREKGIPDHLLARLRQRFALSIHDADLPVGGAQPLCSDDIRHLETMVRRFDPILVSVAFAWSRAGTAAAPDCLPIAYDRLILDRACADIATVQAALGRPVLLENPSAYVAFETSTMRETDFMREVARRTGCGLRLDMARVLTSASNHGYPPERYLADFPLERVDEIRLGQADRQAWSLFESILARTGALPTVIEGAAETSPEAMRAVADRVNRLIGNSPASSRARETSASAH